MADNQGGGEGGGGDKGTVLGAEPKWEDSVPDKFREGGKKDGAINHGAIFKGYTELEGKLRSVGAAPAKFEDYKFELKDEHPITPEALTELRKKAHAAGYTQAHFDVLVNESLGLLGAVSDELVADLLGTEAECNAELAKLWPDKAAESTNRKAANRAFKNVFGGDKDILRLIGNNPKAIAALAKLGATMKEDAPPEGGEAEGAETPEALDKLIDQEMAKPEYTNPFHKDHKAQKEKVAALFARRPGGNNPIPQVAALLR